MPKITPTLSALWFAAALGAAILAAPTATAAVPVDPATHPVSLVGELPAGPFWPQGAIVEDELGNIYVTADWQQEVFRKTPSGGFSAYATVPQVALGMAVSGSTLLAATWSPKRLVSLDLSQPAPVPMTVGNLFRTAHSLVFGCPGFQLLGGSQWGIHDIDPATGTSSTVLSGELLSLSYSPHLGAALATDSPQSRIVQLTSSQASTFATLGSAPNGIAVHPATSDVYVVMAALGEIHRLDATGTTESVFATGLVNLDPTFPTGIAFSRDGKQLYLLEQPGTVLQLSAFAGFPAVTAGTISYPQDGNQVGGHVPISLSLEDAERDNVTASFAFSTDSGATFDPCTTAPTSLVTNPSQPITTPSLSSYIWDSLNDGVSLVAPQPADLRVTVTDGTHVSSTTVTVTVDNSGCSIPLLTVPGYTARSLGKVDIGSSNIRGGIAEDLQGNVYLTSSGLSPVVVYRRPPDGTFAPFVTIPGSRGYGLAVRDEDLYVTVNDGQIHRVDLTAAMPTPVVFASLPSRGLCASRLSPKLVAGTSSNGIYELSIPGGAITPVFDDAEIRRTVAYSGDERTVFSCDHAARQVLEHTLVGGVDQIGPTLSNSPDTVVVHPVTGELFIALVSSTCGMDTLERWDATGTTRITFATGLDLGNNADASPLAFSRDGQRLYFATGTGAASSQAEVFVVEGFAPILTTGFKNLTSGGVVGGDIEIAVDATQSDLLPVTLTLEYSTDAGATFDQCTTSCASLANPAGPLATPVLSATYIWNSIDEFGFLPPLPVELRLTASDGTLVASDQVDLIVDNTTYVAFRLPLCGATENGMISVSFDADDFEGDALVTALDFSTDGGTTFQPCTVDYTSPLSNPSAPLSVPAIGGGYIWNSIDDLLALPPQIVPVELRITVDDGSDTAVALIGVDVDNAWPVMCNVTTPGGTRTGSVDIQLDLMGTSPATFQVETLVSTDDGLTWRPATAAASSPMPGQGAGLGLGTHHFVWDSVTDGVARDLVGSMVRVRFEVRDLGALVASCASARMQIDNTPAALCPGICGDCDGNGVNQIIDSLLMAQMASGLAATPEAGSRHFHSCNVAGEVYPLTGQISVLDALVNARYLVGRGAVGCCVP